MRPKTAAKVAAPNFGEWWTAIIDELFDAPVEERIAALKALDQTLDHQLDLIAEERRPKGSPTIDAVGRLEVVGSIPAGYIRQHLDQQGRGNLEAYVAAIKARS